MSHLIYIGETDKQVAAYLKEKLEKNKNTVEIFSDFSHLAPKLEEGQPELALLNSDIFNGIGLSEKIFKNIIAVVYAREMEIEEKLNYYKLGVKRVIIESVALVSMVLSVSSMIIDRHSNFRQIRQRSLNYGKIQGASLQEILQNAFIEKKNLLIKVNTNGWNAKIRVCQGHIVSAFSPNLENEEAVLKTLHLPIGKFSIRRFRRKSHYSSGISSTPAILAELKFEEKMIRDFFEKVGSNNPQFKISAHIKTDTLSGEKKSLLNVIKENSIFNKIQLNSPFSALKTVRVLSDLLDQNLIYLEGEGDVLETFGDNDIDYIKENIFPEEAKEGKIVIFGLPSSGKSTLIRKIAGQQTKIKTIQYLDFAKIHLRKEITLTLFGISIDENFQSVFEKIEKGMVAYIFLVDSKRKETFEYTKYLLNKMIETYSIPCVVGLTNIDSGNEKQFTEIAQLLGVQEKIPVFAVDPDSFKDALKLIYNLERKTQSEGKNKDV
jgi:signal recognition particle receptor subunit beta